MFQAALGPVALDEVRKMAGGEPDPVLIGYAETVITVCIMSIVITAPIGAIVITLTGPKLLSRTTKPPVLEGKIYLHTLLFLHLDLGINRPRVTKPCELRFLQKLLTDIRYFLPP